MSSADDEARAEDETDDDAEKAAQEEGEREFEEATRKREVLDALRKVTAGRQATYSVAPGLVSGKAIAIFDGAGITAEGGDPGAVGKFIIAVERFLDSVGADVVLTALNFASSLRIELEPRLSTREKEELEQIQSEEASASAETDRSALVPRSVIGLEAAARILREPPERVVDRVRVLGAEAREELRKLSETLDEDEVSLRFTSATQTEAVVTSREARGYARRLRQSEELEPRSLTVVGKLSRTDSEARQFRVVLDRDLMPPELDGRRRHVEGGYTAKASRQVRDGGLWDRTVVARVRANMARPPGGGKARATDFSFTDVKPRDPPGSSSAD